MASAPTNVRVVIESADGRSEPDHDRVGDHNYQDFRDWIMKTTHWAVRNGRKVTITPVER
jgi:hypothetical protein